MKLVKYLLNIVVVIGGAEEPPADPATAPVVPGKECTIEINKDKMGLGLSIVGGSDTLLVTEHDCPVSNSGKLMVRE